MAVCVKCGYDLNGEPDHASCSRCGTTRQVIVGADGATRVVGVFAPTISTESNFPDGSREVTTGSSSYKSVALTGPTGERSQVFTGRPPLTEEDVLQACESVWEVLKLRGEQLPAKFRRPPSAPGQARGHETGVDAICDRADGPPIEVQVVGVTDPVRAPSLAKTGSVTSSKSAVEMADHICHLVRRKASHGNSYRAGRFLVVDALRSPDYLHDDVIDALRAPERLDGLRTSGFEEVWLSGPLVRNTRRLDDLEARGGAE